MLRTCNQLLRRLSKGHNAVLCGRILIFLARLLPLSDRSGINLQVLSAEMGPLDCLEHVRLKMVPWVTGRFAHFGRMCCAWALSLDYVISELQGVYNTANTTPIEEVSEVKL
jgi:THO complex subunit 1 transcription elongation factor